MSPRTVKYVEAMIREGDTFAYDRWLKRVREEEAQANQPSAASASGQNASVQRGNQKRTSDTRNAWPRAASALIAKAIPVPKAIRRSAHDLKGTTSKARLRRWLEKVRVAWDDFQASRARDAVYDYLEAVFAVVMHYKVRRRTNRLLRHAFAFADLPFDKKADPFTAVIRCTCDDIVDNKTISKWARALRYASRRKKPEMRLKTFMKDAGGVNACAAGYSKLRRRSSGRN